MTLRRRFKRIGLASCLPVVLGATFAASAGASYHEYRISEVHQGTATATGDYVELQAFSANQNLVGGHYVYTYDGANNPMSTFQFPTLVNNAASQATILIANDASVTGADFIAPGGLNVVNTNGAACFIDTLTPLTGVDCVDWGPAMGGTLPSPAGTPLPGALADNQSFSRSIARGCATALDPADDTNNSSADFALAAPSPRPNSATPTETLCPPTKGGKKKKCKKKKKKKGGGGKLYAKKKKCKKKKKK
jgi:hypothetical protein